MKPDSNQHNPDPAYLRRLLERAGITQRAAAQQIGISDRVMRYYLMSEDSESFRPAPYPVQYALEQIANCTPSQHE